MKPALYTGLIVLLVPVQTTALQHASIGGIRPDLCLVAACLVGVFAGEIEGLLFGLAVGFVQDLFSAGAPWINLATKGVVGLLAGLAGRHVANATPTTLLGLMLGLSLLSGVAVLALGGPSGGLANTWLTVRTVLLPQAAFDAAVCAGAYWLVTRWVRSGGTSEGVRALFER